MPTSVENGHNFHSRKTRDQRPGYCTTVVFPTDDDADNIYFAYNRALSAHDKQET